eukprot:6479316-Amphidinium_carterae.1
MRRMRLKGRSACAAWRVSYHCILLEECKGGGTLLSASSLRTRSQSGAFQRRGVLPADLCVHWVACAWEPLVGGSSESVFLCSILCSSSIPTQCASASR